MNKSILKEFAIESRKDLMDRVKLKLNMYYLDEDLKFTSNGDIYTLSNNQYILKLTKEEFNKRELLLTRIKEIGIDRVIEESAYTWFNRLIAIRYMEIHDFLPLGKNNESLGIRVLSSYDNTPNPELMKYSNLINNQLDIFFNQKEYSICKNENEKFKYLLQLICNKLKKVFPDVFGGSTDYIDLLIPENLLSETGFVSRMINKIPESEFSKVEIIGWLYQYYNQTEKDRVISSKKAYKKHEIAYATQLFTPDWIVKYMVENSLGKFWIEHGGNKNLKNKWKFYIENELDQKEKLKPEEIKFIDPCCGSGHILVYAFEIFYQIYLDEGYSKNDIPKLILENNISGLDVDDRAGQLSILALILKAREYDKNLFSLDIIQNLNVMSMQETDNINISINSEKIKSNEIVKYLINHFKDAKNLGSLLITNELDFEINNDLFDNNLFDNQLKEKLKPIIKQAKILSLKYDVVVTNPPYMSDKGMNNNIKNYVSKKYPEGKNDLFATYILSVCDLTKKDNYISMITPFVWMFISSYEKLRNIFVNKYIDSMIQLEYNSFEAACVPVVTFTFKNENKNGLGKYIKLSDFPGYDVQEQKTLEAINNKDCEYIYSTENSNFKKIPGNTIAFWLSDKVFDSFKNGIPLSSLGTPTNGMFTCDNNKFLRKWYEVSYNDIYFNCNSEEDSKKSDLKWYPYNKGGDFRKWYGNHNYVINFKHFGKEVSNFRKEKGQSASFPGQSKYFEESISWSLVSNYKFAARYYPKGFVFDIAGSSYFPDSKFKYILGFLTSNIAIDLLNILNPTMNFQIGDVSKIPLIYDKELEQEINELVDKCVLLAKNDWDMYETSWNFDKDILIKTNEQKLSDAVSIVRNQISKNKELERTYERRLNEIFAKIYSLTINKDITLEIEDRDLSVKDIDEKQLIKNLISYFVGCLFGRYSVSSNGISDRFSSFVDNDNIIPLIDSNAIYYDDDIVSKFQEFIKNTFGEECYNENIDFIADTIGRKNTESSIDTIRRYFCNDFINDHIKMYQKRPIYWLISSGKKNGFKCLIYMHRYTPSLLSTVRVNYLHKIQDNYKRLLDEYNYIINNNSISNIERKNLQINITDISNRLSECNEFDEKLGHLANKMINIDLDDGFKYNYSLFDDIVITIK